GLTNDWKYNGPSLDGVPWKNLEYNDSGWTGHGPGLLWADSRIPPNPTGIPNLAAQMPVNPGTTYPYTTYYFRTHFNYTNSLTGVTLTFSNYIDDGAVFYLNGVEINRLYLPANPASS